MKPADVDKNIKMYILHVLFIYLSVTRALRHIRLVENGDSVSVEKLAVMTSGSQVQGRRQR